MSKLPEGLRESPGAGVPRKTFKAAALAAGIVAIIAGVSILTGGTPKDTFAHQAKLAAIYGGALFVSLFVLILFALALMRSGIDWRKRGGKPDPFTRT